jgi:hypothetical protein
MSSSRRRRRRRRKKEEEEEQEPRGTCRGIVAGKRFSTQDESVKRRINLQAQNAGYGSERTLMILTVLKRSISSNSSPCSSFLSFFRRARRSSLSFSFSSALARLRAPSAAAPLARARGIFLHCSRHLHPLKTPSPPTWAGAYRALQLSPLSPPFQQGL